MHLCAFIDIRKYAYLYKRIHMYTEALSFANAYTYNKIM